MNIKLSKETIQKCRDFADARTNDSVTVYQGRGEARRQKIYADILFGTLAEFAVASLLAGSSEPDLNIYKVAKKSYSSDLQYKDLNIHVKSQGIESATRYGLSWIFQRTDPVVSSPKTNDILALCCVEEDLSVTISGLLKARDAQFKDLKVPQYRNTKLALYISDILEYVISKEELDGIEKEKIKEV